MKRLATRPAWWQLGPTEYRRGRCRKEREASRGACWHRPGKSREPSLHPDGPIELSSLEFKLLRYFVEHRGELLSRRDLLEHVWGYLAALQTRTVDVHVASPRQKIERHPAKPDHIVTVHRMGYRFRGRSGRASPVRVSGASVATRGSST
jgi:DNA-binding response OmpR family regulator